MNKIKSILLFTAISAISIFASSNLVLAATATKSDIQCGINAAAGQGCTAAAPTGSLDKTLDAIINILSTVVGIVAVIMLVIGAFRYITSGGNDQAVASAKKTIIYALIGLVIVALAETIVKFVLGKVIQ
ncbi:MAG TPA: pilin [Candidatus Saccharimonadales bacterium]|nr:pilin [Candidatus Saccharimonadales bacterium]